MKHKTEAVFACRNGKRGIGFAEKNAVTATRNTVGYFALVREVIEIEPLGKSLVERNVAPPEKA